MGNINKTYMVKENLNIVYNDFRYGFVDAHGKEVIPFVYRLTTEFRSGFAVVVDDETQYRKFIDTSGKVVFSLECELASLPFQGKTIFKKNEKWGVIDIISGKTVLPCEYDDIDYLDCDTTVRNDYFCLYQPDLDDNYYEEKTVFWTVEKDNKTGLIDVEGNFLLPIDYEKIYEVNDIFSNGEHKIFKLKKGDKWGLQMLTVTLSVKEILPFEYDEIRDYENNDKKMFFYVKKDDKWGIVDIDGKITVSCEYDEIIPCNEHKALLEVKKDDKFGVIDFYGNVILQCDYDKIKMIYDKDEDNVVFCVKKDEEWDVISPKN